MGSRRDVSRGRFKLRSKAELRMHSKSMKRSLLQRFCFAVLLTAIVLPASGFAQDKEAPDTDFSKMFDKTDAMIPARDGIKLHTEIYAPKNQSGPLPIILERTPYGTADDKNGYSQ